MASNYVNNFPLKTSYNGLHIYRQQSTISKYLLSTFIHSPNRAIGDENAYGMLNLLSHTVNNCSACQRLYFVRPTAIHYL